MFDIAYSLLFDVIGMLKWFIPLLLLFGVIAQLIKAGK